MIYRLLFCPSREPIIISFLLASSVERSAQLLRVCRSCCEEASPVLYGGNEFALHWAFTGIEPYIIEFFENIGTNNRQFVRHLRARHSSIWTLEKIRARRSLRPVLENLDSLRLEFYNSGGTVRSQRPYSQGDGVCVLKSVRRYLKAQRGPFQKLGRVFKIAAEYPYSFEKLRLASAVIRLDPKVDHLVAHPALPY